MGKRNRERRRAKQQRQSRTTTTPHHRDRTHDRDRDHDRETAAPLAPDRAFALLVQANADGSSVRCGQLLQTLASQWASGRDGAGVPGAVSTALRAAVARAWSIGWQPADLVHATARKETARFRRLLVDAVAGEAEQWRDHTDADPRWIAHLDDIGARRWWPADVAHLDAWVARDRLDRVDALLESAHLVGVLWRLPSLTPVSQPPSAWGRPGASTSSSITPRRPARAGIDERVLKRVRALLAKAESTDFDAEADSLTAKAQELMARYSIDHTMIGAAGSDPRGENPEARRVLIHDPYAKGKSLLLSRVAEASRCRAITTPDLGFSTVFGYPIDLEVVEILYTSLVTQCSVAMQAASRKVANPRSFRESFTVAFASRIGQRLQEAAEATVEAGVRDHGDSLLPVLASRESEVEAALDAAFPGYVRRSFRASDGRGWAAGTAAADVATIAAGKPLAS